jgi:hypothetical protein
MLLAVADAIVPRFEGHPAASEIDLLPRLERCIEASPDGAEFYRRNWSRFERDLRQRVPFPDGPPAPEALHATLEQWHREYVSQHAPSPAARYFEGLRRNVLLAYYTSPDGWASVGYAGPGHSEAAPQRARLD